MQQINPKKPKISKYRNEIPDLLRFEGIIREEQQSKLAIRCSSCKSCMYISFHDRNDVEVQCRYGFTRMSFKEIILFSRTCENFEQQEHFF
ncbi:hypothetical protein NEF87_004924 [Candidatus Lokiarchaeum ossiferum]|uniref:Uncharacterized protein n=1 Tax=Candidatus Lokiarchaeum ossiferum TaxID=2951803 RepID=A0ABY6HYM9_9ARCH|nr:hypothetical protein NEF87_004924 [Candidatus Lokiarchaeum sp. B-35]